MKTKSYHVQKSIPLFLLFCLVILFNSNFTYAQKRGSLSGLILDSLTLKPVSGATVELNETYSAYSGESGQYALLNIPKGKYTVTVSAAGYGTFIRENFIVTNSDQSLDIKLTEKVNLVPGVTIRPKHFQKDMNEFVGSVKFNHEEVKRISGNFDDIVRSLAVLPGVAQIDNYRNDLIVRGGSPAENLYTVDGIVLPNINHFGNQGFSGGVMSFINMDFVSSTSFSSGGFPAQFGDKISSVTQINLRDGRNDKIGGKAVISATQFALNLEGPLSSKSTFILSARRSYLDLVFRASGFSFAPEYYDLFAKTNTKLNNFTQVSFLLFGVMDRVKFFDMGGNLRDENPRAMGSNQNNYVAAATLRSIFNKGYFNLSFSSNHFGYETVPNNIFDYNSVEEENAFKGDFVLNFSPDDELDFGTTAKLVNFKANVKLSSFFTPYEETLTTKGFFVEKEYFKGGIYAQYSHRFWKAVKMGLGLRGDFYDSGREDNTISPRFFTQVALLKSTNLNFSLGVYRQTPNDLWNSLNPANEKLRSIRSDQLTAGIDHRLSDEVRISVEGFYKVYRDYPASLQRPYLIMSNTGAGFTGVDDNFSSFGLDTLVNAGKGWVKGIEFSIQKKFSESPFWGALNLTYSKATFEGVDQVERAGSYDQNWIMHLAVGYVFDEKWEIDFKFRYASGIPYTPFDNNGKQLPSLFNSARLEEQHSLDMRLDRRWNFGSWKLRTYLDVQNLYNHKVRTMIRWERSENRIANDPILGIVPSIGISLEI
ncbi:MAG TPA: TonB-dependent receptor [Ignavibacteriales bacterium]|nr:TonB-dependent receptor [Ignavibacteriales bacterium]